MSRILAHILQSLTVALLVGIGHYVMDLQQGADSQAREIAELTVTVQDLKSLLVQYNLPQMSSDVAVLKSESMTCTNLGKPCRETQ